MKNEQFSRTKTPTIEVSEDCISREWLRNVFGLSEKTRKWGGDHSGYNTMMLYEIQDYIEDAPSVVPKDYSGESTEMVGEWKWKSEDICDNCGYEIPHLEKVIGDIVLMDSKDWTYCPNCGVKR